MDDPYLRGREWDSGEERERERDTDEGGELGEKGDVVLISQWASGQLAWVSSLCLLFVRLLS